MKIETQFDVGDEVYYLYNNRVVHKKINSIKIYKGCGEKDPVVKYGFDSSMGSYEQYDKEVFATKEELLKSL